MTEREKHTPGPWWNDGHGCIRRTSDDSTIAELCRDDGNCDMRCPMPVEANGDLIAAAPDLLAACKAALAYLDTRGDGEVVCVHRAVLSDAISKAKGGVA